VKEGAFREDLYYRLNVFPIWLPPLRERASDIPALARHFMVRFITEEGRGHIGGIAPEALELLMAYDWPGNIRQLENAVFRAVILCDDTELGKDHFPQVTAQMPEFEPSKTFSATIGKLGNGVENTALLSASLELPKETGLPVQHHAGGESHYALAPMLSGDGELRKLEDVEADLIRFAIDHHKGRMTRVAKSLGIGRSTLYRKLKDLGLEPGSDRDAAE